ncbi:MAG: rhombosortase [Opitutae bacterium]|nr:rhombosortase [Opitutae bacterium]
MSALGAVALGAWPSLGIVFEYRRDALVGGELWRAWTDHLAHFGASHLFWNLLLFLPTGVWLERNQPWLFRAYLFFSAPLISAVLYFVQPDLLAYRGLSGLAAGMLVLLSCWQLSCGSRRESSWFWFLVLTLLAGKIICELITGNALLASDLQDVGPVPMAHVSGGGTALSTWALYRKWRRKPAGAS